MALRPDKPTTVERSSYDLVGSWVLKSRDLRDRPQRGDRNDTGPTTRVQLPKNPRAIGNGRKRRELIGGREIDFPVRKQGLPGGGQFNRTAVPYTHLTLPTNREV